MEDKVIREGHGEVDAAGRGGGDCDGGPEVIHTRGRVQAVEEAHPPPSVLRGRGKAEMREDCVCGLVMRLGKRKNLDHVVLVSRHTSHYTYLHWRGGVLRAEDELERQQAGKPADVRKESA